MVKYYRPEGMEDIRAFLIFLLPEVKNTGQKLYGYIKKNKDILPYNIGGLSSKIEEEFNALIEKTKECALREYGFSSTIFIEDVTESQKVLSKEIKKIYGIKNFLSYFFVDLTSYRVLTNTFKRDFKKLKGEKLKKAIDKMLK